VYFAVNETVTRCGLLSIFNRCFKALRREGALQDSAKELNTVEFIDPEVLYKRRSSSLLDRASYDNQANQSRFSFCSPLLLNLFPHLMFTKCTNKQKIEHRSAGDRDSPFDFS
jgi:hypothetical protein